ncbi:PTS-dependent dihydroxyacetone kinase phosphotransferase subunit DhaM [Nonomuraea antimicrobica]
MLVSHSAGLAAEAVALARGIAGQDAPLAAAGGTQDGGLGTSVDLVEAAVRSVDRGHGVVIIPDLGSSVLTARLLAEAAPRVVVADVPFVEGPSRRRWRRVRALRWPTSWPRQRRPAPTASSDPTPPSRHLTPRPRSDPSVAFERLLQPPRAVFARHLGVHQERPVARPVEPLRHARQVRPPGDGHGGQAVAPGDGRQVGRGNVTVPSG